MNITLIEKEHIFGLTLPEKIKGRYWITDIDDNLEERKLLSVEAVNGSWVIRSNSIAKLYSGNNNYSDEILLTDNAFYRVEIEDVPDKVYIYTECESESRQRYDKYLVNNDTEITIGRNSDNIICIHNNLVSSNHAILNYVSGQWTISDDNSTNGTFVNNARISTTVLNVGDVVYIVGVKIIIGSNFIAINNPDNLVSIDKRVLKDFLIDNTYINNTVNEINDSEFFYRSPRFKRDIACMEIKVDGPPQAERVEKVPMPLLIGPSLTMGMASLTSGAFSVMNTLENGNKLITAAPTLAMSVSMLLGMVMWPILTKKHEKKNKLKAENDRQRKYKEYLFSIKDLIYKEEQKQTEILYENNICTEDCVARIINREATLWERTGAQNDFLLVRLGLGDVPLNAKITFPDKRFSMITDNLIADMFALQNESKNLTNVPITYSIKDNIVGGVIGEDKTLVKKFIIEMLVKIIALHSYDEVKIVIFADKNDLEYIEEFRWVPHIWDAEEKVRFFATELKEAKEISAYLEKVFYERCEQRNKEQVLPHYVIFNFNKEISEKVEIYEKILCQKENCGFSVINVYDEFKNLPKETSKVIEINEDYSKLYDKDDITGNAIKFNADVDMETDVNVITRAIASIKLDNSGNKYSLPDMLTFLDMFEAGNIEHLNPLMRWKENDPTQSLSAPIGVDTMGEKFTLDLHEKFQGPHGLVAGMTGSGKSEFIITYILSMAVNYHPDEVAFILIDYKGGGLTGAFENKDLGVKLPHLAGTITNLDGAAVKRSLISIQSELRRRQAIFNDARRIANEGTMDIYKYQKLYRNKIVDIPVPHLFIISDEFAELKTQQPEFMEQLISAARIGRSLGVHLILATQKPNGVVDDQIWSNTRFRVCLKVQEKADSNDMIKRPDAAELSNTGRFYLQVGFNELFAMGQSAWCGAPYYEQAVAETKPNVIEVISNTGASIKELKQKPKGEVATSKIKQIVGIVKYLSDLAAEENINVRPLWKEPIPPVIYIEEVEEKYNIKEEDKHILAPLVGEIDDPFNQSQFEFKLPLTEGGNTIIYGTAGSGKLSFITTVIYNIIKNHSPEYANLYILDFGSETLKMFEKAPHVGGVVLSSERERVINLLKMLKTEIAERKKLFVEYGGDYMSYIKFSGNVCPNIVVVINNYAVFAEMYEDCDEIVSYITREGSKYGVYFVLTATNTGSVRYRLVQNFKNLYVLHMNDRTDYAAILGPTEGVYPSDYKGRGLVKMEHTYEFQTAFVASEDSILNKVKTLIEMLNTKEHHNVARKIPVLPEHVNIEYLDDYSYTLDKFPMGVDKKTLDLIEFNLSSNYISFVLADDVDKTLSYAQGMAEALTLKNLARTVVIDSTGQFIEDAEKNYTYINSDFENAVVDMFNDTVRRHKLFKENGNVDSEEHVVYVIASISKLLQALSADGQDKLKVTLAKGKSELKVSFVIAEEGSIISKMTFDEWYKNHCSNVSGVWIGDGSSEQYVLKITKINSELYQEFGDEFGVYISKGKYRIIKTLVSKFQKEE